MKLPKWSRRLFLIEVQPKYVSLVGLEAETRHELKWLIDTTGRNASEIVALLVREEFNTEMGKHLGYLKEN